MTKKPFKHDYGCWWAVRCDACKRHADRLIRVALKKMQAEKEATK